MTPGSSTATHHGLPTLSDSRRASSSAFSSMTSASLSRSSMRSFGVFDCHSSHALFAASTARSTSSAVPRGTSAITSPVAGFRTSIVSPDVESTNSPPMNCFCWVTETLTPTSDPGISAERIAGVRERYNCARSCRTSAPCGFSSSEPAAWAPRSPRSRSGARSSSTARSRTTTRRGPSTSSASSTTAASARTRSTPRARTPSSRSSARRSADAVLNSVDPLFNVPIFDACFEAGVTYLDMAMTLSEPHPTNPYEEVGVKLGDYQFERAAGMGGEGPARARRHRHRAGRGGRLRAPRGRRALLRDRRGRHPRRREPRRRGLRLRPDLLDLDDDRGVPEPARDLGAGAWLVHDRAVLRAGGLRLPGGHRPGRVRERRARGGAARAALDRLQARHLQVRARRRVHRGAEDPPQARARLEGEDLA